MLKRVEKSTRGRKTPKEPEGWPLFEVWNKYEKIAMHFNDLLIRLRTQALRRSKALSTFASIFAKTDATSAPWPIALGIFFALWLFWIAIWVLDLKYYNRLLRGSVHALLEVGELSKTQTHITEIQMSTRIEKSVAGSLGSFTPLNGCERMHLRIGVWTFYGLVFFARLVRVRILDLQMLRHVVFLSVREGLQPAHVHFVYRN